MLLPALAPWVPLLRLRRHLLPRRLSIYVGSGRFGNFNLVEARFIKDGGQFTNEIAVDFQFVIWLVFVLLRMAMIASRPSM